MNPIKWIMTTVSLITVISMAVYVGATGAFFNDNEQVYGDSLGFQWGLVNLTEDFENTADWDAQWDENEVTSWNHTSTKAWESSYSALTNKDYKGLLTSDEIDASQASNITISFYYTYKNLTAGQVHVQIFDGENYETIFTIPGGTNNDWVLFNEIITDNDYFIPGFRLRFNSTSLTAANYNTYVYIDDINILTDNQKPAAPLNLTAAAGDTTVFLEWDANSETDLAGYSIYRNTDGSDNYNSPIATGITTPYYTDTSLANGITYYYVINAYDTGNNYSVFSNQANATPSNQPPAAPTGLTAAPGNRVIYLDWNNNTDSDLAGYNLYRSLTAGSGYTQINGTLIPAGTI
ncbi:MAG: hypothetical protein GX631_08435, partial [Dehalococcoidales bacterium]|nr:hypothetical protein [Dehalococcoidales bacterium]